MIWTVSRTMLATGAWMAVVSTAVLAQDEPSMSWPQWGGVTRNFQLPDTSLRESWPPEGPPVIWRRALGDGNSGIAVVGDRLYTMHRRGDDEVVVALDRASGATVWERSSPQPVWEGFFNQFGYGPHTTPLVIDERVYVIGIRGRLSCLDRRTGELVWERELWESFDVAAYEFGPAQLGYSSSPLAFESTLIAVGGGDGHAVIALDLASGETVWRSQDFPPGFASPILIDVDGETQVVVFAADRVAGLDPRSGRLLWEHPHETAYMVNAATPVWGDDNLLFVSSAYDTGARALRLRHAGGETSVTEVWTSRAVEVHHQSVVRVGDVIHASSGDFGPAFVTGVDALTGEEVYKMRGFAKANFLAVGDDLLILDEDGSLAFLQVGEGEPVIKARAEVLETRSWTAPTMVDGVLYLRDREEIVALDLRAD